MIEIIQKLWLKLSDEDDKRDIQCCFIIEIILKL